MATVRRLVDTGRSATNLYRLSSAPRRDTVVPSRQTTLSRPIVDELSAVITLNENHTYDGVLANGFSTARCGCAVCQGRVATSAVLPDLKPPCADLPGLHSIRSTVDFNRAGQELGFPPLSE